MSIEINPLQKSSFLKTFDDKKNLIEIHDAHGVGYLAWNNLPCYPMLVYLRRDTILLVIQYESIPLDIKHMFIKYILTY